MDKHIYPSQDQPPPLPGHIANFPALYHTHNSLEADDIQFWLDLAGRQGSPILELGCGTGRVLLPLAQAGHRVIGLEIDPAMLAYLRSRLPLNLKSKVDVLQGDLQAFHLGLTFPLIVLPCNTYTTLPAGQRRRALERLALHLGPEGVFAASLPNPAFLKRLPRHADPDIEITFPHPLDGEPVQVSSAWVRTVHQVILTWIYDHLSPDGTVDRLSFQVTQNILSVEEIMDELHSAGLRVRQLYGDFDGSRFSNDSLYLIFIAEKLPERFL